MTDHLYDVMKMICLLLVYTLKKVDNSCHPGLYCNKVGYIYVILQLFFFY